MHRRSADADIFQAIAHPTRRRILELLADGERPVLALAESFRVSVPAVSQHLGVLRAASLVAERREGRQRVYHITPEPLREVAAWMQRYERFWVDRLHKLDAFLARHNARAVSPPQEIPGSAARPPRPKRKARR